MQATELVSPLDRDSALCSIHKIRYFPTISEQPLVKTAIVRLHLELTLITLHKTQGTQTNARDELYSLDLSESEEGNQDEIHSHNYSPCE